MLPWVNELIVVLDDCFPQVLNAPREPRRLSNWPIHELDGHMGGYIIVRGGDYRAETEDMSYIPRVTPLVSCPNSASFNPLGYEFPLVPH